MVVNAADLKLVDINEQLIQVPSLRSTALPITLQDTATPSYTIQSSTNVPDFTINNNFIIVHNGVENMSSYFRANTTITMQNGNKMVLNTRVYDWNPNLVYYLCKMYDSTNNIIGECETYVNLTNIGTGSGQISEAGFIALYDASNNRYLMGFYKGYYESNRVNIEFWFADSAAYALNSTTQFIEGNTPPEYVWIPLEQLSGNNDQFRLSLSQIKAEYIGDAFTAVITTERSRFIFAPQSNIARLIANVPNNIETVIAYSGNNYMTVIRRFSEGIAPYNNIFFKFKFYNESNMLLYETEEYGISEPAISYMYLSFIFDRENEVGWIDLIKESLTNDNIIYNDPPAVLPSPQDLSNIWLWLQASGDSPAEDDPYSTGSTDDGGEPGTPRMQDHITDTPAPTISGLNLGIITLYQPDDYELGKISQFLWSDDVLDNFKKYFNNFADNILALYVLPFTPDNLPTKAFTVGKMTSDDAALQAVSYCTQRYFDIDMGSVQIDGRWDSYLDYAPYTRIEIYLPYCGLHSLDIDELMSPAQQNGTLPTDQGCTLSLKYRLDILTGVIVAKLSVNGEIRYQFNGKVGANIPLTGQTFSNLLGAIVGAAGSAAVTVTTGGMTAPLAVGAAASAAGTVMAQKPNVESIGNISADASMLATKIPYVRISSPNKPLLEKQQDFTGFPSYKSGTLSQFNGYTEVLEAHIEGIACTEEERSEILTLLKAGVIL